MIRGVTGRKTDLAFLNFILVAVASDGLESP